MSTNQHEADKATLRAIMERENDWCGQGGASSYLGGGRWAFTETSINVTPDELNALFRLAGVEPREIQSLGTCADCANAINGRERGYKAPCLDCCRPIMSNFRPKQ